MWIRSQDKRTLVDVTTFCLYSEGENEEPWVQSAWESHSILDSNFIDGTNCLGTYNTEERALEVLDEIQQHIIAIQKATLGCVNGHEVNYVYQMPEK